MNIGHYTKSIVTILAAGLGVLTAALSDGQVTATEYVNIAIAIVTAVGVYLLPNLPGDVARITKTLVAAGGAALAALVSILGGTLGFLDVTQADWLTVVLAGLAAIGVYILPNEAAVPVVATVPATTEQKVAAAEAVSVALPVTEKG